MSKLTNRLRLLTLRGTFMLASRILPGPTGRYLARRFVTPQAAGRAEAAAALSASADVQTGTLELNGIKICTYVWGDPSSQPYVLFSHGWSSYAMRFVGWVPLLRSMGYAVVGFDQPAHGLSSGDISHMPQFVEVLQQVGRHFGKPAAVIAHSLGASSIIFAQEEQWRPDRFVLIAPFLAPADNALHQFETFGIAHKVFAPFEGYLHALSGRRFADYDASARLQLLDRPALVIHDRRDRETPWEKGARFAKLWPGARLFTTEGLGHNRLIDHPSVTAEVMEFLKPDSHLPTPIEP
ncbi:hydrolase [Pseudomonas amygdali pv. tabaci str. ATCC 11528]|uniref:alpha/beta hydrolase n=1 Tax=Pseudomonas syringae group TaxID=136849 RepID=UPI0001BC94B8|nr:MULTISPECIES: alpha/beta hydrolase [Pseudomonas syringae group]KEZ69686.1 hydrolase [Pseudomonas amygdali pv. tabaci str. ATCC 11528]KKY52513.1 hydrolase [Pseudomonas amygdali pv. tabaci str. ATCC 11528]MDU8605549.1 alpha/beta hydrolase [Pseudomonas syringae group sp. 247E2]MDU8643959.1 alpha/beta hydrolase [Pseudomonas syringae group sp. 26L6]QED85607.1 alpha/beta hydrolase [Pseudomonas amygdali pv. tabaci str. ATCC 11528]